MEGARRLRAKLAAGQITTGVLATDLLWPQLVEFLQQAEIDYLIADQEHGVHGDALVAEVCAVARQVDFPVLIRPVDTESSTIRRAVDRGPCGLLLPTVESAHQLDRVRDCIWMPPRGTRRPGGPGNYWVGDFHYETWKREVEDDFLVLPQIESRAGLERLDEIAGHEITTAMAIGPYDLSMDLGVGAQMDHPRLMEAITHIRAAAERAGKTMWRIGHGPTMVREGFHFLCIGEPMAMLKGALAQAQLETSGATR
ncbi:MAG: aldolase/citrate lyase family protein [Candidatus Latescibacteria bacterium]|jgi:2-keto-3-deoxy-L-rhamnonate aldolase RhmA|nr:aldolase/citrate lyase family protein [Candidatus Latescibacterota bacterium]